jgi:NAD(P)-dependent dehydrogenase (short-subunit alcohol dehydrogenase family)
MQGIADQVAVVSGAGRGNGQAIARGLAAAGAMVAVCDIDGESARETAAAIATAGGRALAWALDVTDRAACTRISADVEAALGSAAILVNNAGIIRRVPFDAPNAASDWDATLAVNATGAMNLTRAFLPQLRRTAGRVVNLGSILSIAGGRNVAAYAASKGAILQLTRALAVELADQGIRVNAVAPGVIDTPMTADTRADSQAIGRFMAHTPMGRTGQPEELVGPILFLASDMSSYVTGALLPVDGGYLTA